MPNDRPAQLGGPIAGHAGHAEQRLARRHPVVAAVGLEVAEVGERQPLALHGSAVWSLDTTGHDRLQVAASAAGPIPRDHAGNVSTVAR